MAFYATANLQDQYKRDYITMASPIDLIIMLYEGCIKQLKLAKIHKENNELDKVSECFQKAEDIILELVGSLNLSISISENLLELYQFMLDEIVQANITKDMERVDPVIEMMTLLYEAWNEIKVKAESDIYTQNEE
ncbi:flagellar export chaperone FliS [Christensenella tenuis]|uniref:Flagellar secretion chaperone FliS n=1 Tax=Christensenella tenuis TaxID=2763033 RepID=A0ABR7ECF8_9FIRM|nr:flagellar export chaperone FliS [Christensenella tenuis]MBC5646734.1 flagellar export chaperone FliS [Christensenella tenuis]